MPIKHTSIESTIIKSIGYDPIAKTMEVNFHKTGIYIYPNFPEMEYKKLIQADSKGTHFNTYIKNRYLHRKGVNSI